MTQLNNLKFRTWNENKALAWSKVPALILQVAPVGKDLEIVGAKEAWMERSIFILDDLEFV